MKKSTVSNNFLKYSAVLLAAATTAAFVAQAPATAQTNPFTDVKSNNTHYHAIMNMYSEGIVTGVTATSYKPGQDATRGEAALFLANALGLNTKNVKNPGFTDVSSSSNYYGAVAALYEKGIVGGYGTMFKPNNTLTRAQLAKMLTLGFELEQSAATTTKFADVNKLTDAATKRYIQTLVQYSITSGTTATTFSPNKNLTRGQLATFLDNAMNAVSDDFDVIDVQ
ncbi:S-layer homology domain-containing protein [Solibacillus sp. FSL H8-0538]|uniref:S-layer homology domain-containing protein n=1 Tax=Solibacillus sp. FSL H8-0538 TaxID=2921400 RepID=UPI0030FB485E